MLDANGRESMDQPKDGDASGTNRPCPDGRGRMPSPRDEDRAGGGDEPSLLLGADEAADLVGVSRSEFYRLDTTGQVPSPVRFGKVKRWVRSILKRWADAGCPARHDFEGSKR
jgi:predicted DNA-binding transcriptional regulator AlpA